MEKREPYAKELNDVFDALQNNKPFIENTKKARELMTYYHCAMLEMETKLNVLNEQFAIENERNPIDSIKSRIKSFTSIHDKLKRRGYELSLESIEKNLNDVAGIRVICSFVDDIYMIADCLSLQDDVKILERKDYILNPKENGYRSLHLIVEVPIFLKNEKKKMRVEIQLRTIAMEFWANLEHKIRYKKNLDEEKEKAIDQGLKECAMISSTLDTRMYEIRQMVSD